MSEREIAAPNGSISVTVSMKGAAGGNELLAEAQAKANAIAATTGKQISLDGYGVKRDGEDITITFAIKG